MSKFVKKDTPRPSTSSEHPKTTKILLNPSKDIQITPRTYTEEEQQKIDDLRAYADTLKLPDSDPYHPWEARWLADPGCAERYMRASKWKLDDAKKRISGTIAWRREFKPDLISPEDVRVESETGKIVLNGFDVNGRPIITMNPGRENTNPSERQIRHLIFILERAIDLMPQGQDSLVIIVNYKETTLRTNPSISVARRVLNILQQHYVERLGRAIVVNLPFLLEFFYRGISPFLDPITRDKMRFNPNLKELVPEDHLQTEFGGSFNYEFEPVSYWDDLLKFCRIAEDGTRLPIEHINPPTEPETLPQINNPPKTLSTPSAHSDDGSSSDFHSVMTPDHAAPASEDHLETTLNSAIETKLKIEDKKAADIDGEDVKESVVVVAPVQS